MTSVTCVGLAVLDVVFGVGASPGRGQKTFAESMALTGGGPAANAAATIARLDGDAHFIGHLGEDPVAKLILDDFAAWGVDAGRVRLIPTASSPVSTITVEPDGERTIVNYSDPRLFSAEAGLTANDVLGADAVLGDLLWPSGALSAMYLARDLGVPGILDFDHARPVAIDEALTAPTHIIFSAPALAATSGEDDPASGLSSLRARTESWIAVTLGGDGVVWLDDDGEARSAPAFDVEVVDTLGAGDVFHGAFALGLAEQRPIEEVIRRASATAALKCTRFGGRSGIPSAREVEAFLRRHSD
jgi:sulfofructose kinase